ncbi:MAG TPA: excinuclease ABC subunit UvrC [Acidimicrobiales bacterium]|nr:excinuclease ABC subunit UvrC [Acidimicrobiales bacterium]
MLPAPTPSTIPDGPGVYVFRDPTGTPLYVGKARSLRARLSNYFADPLTLPERTERMVAAAASVDWTVTASEVDALLLENSLIKTYQPRFNVRLKDDKSYPYLAVDLREEWPRPQVVRGRRRRGVRYFGPFGHAKSLRSTLDLLLPTFPVRTCSDAKFARHRQRGRPCLLADLGRCAAPCVGWVDHPTYDEHVQGILRFFAGDAAALTRDLEARMQAAAAAQDYEAAARLRDALGHVERASDTQQVLLSDRDDLDAVGIANDELQSCVVRLELRRGRVTGRESLRADLVDDLGHDELLERLLGDLYDAERPPPREVVVDRVGADLDRLSAWLTTVRGAPVRVVAPDRGRRRGVVELATANAAEDLRRHGLRRAADHNARSRSLVELQSALGLARAPYRIECFDMSHLQGTSYVGSMVVFEDALPVKRAYRHFTVKTVRGNDDVGAMREVLDRRLAHWREVPGGDRFGANPDLLVVDGGLGQLNAAVAAVEARGVTGQVELASLAKRLEEVFRPGGSRPLVLPRTSEALYLLQRIRDEAHRFAISFHRSTRGRRMTASLLDGIEGLGPTRRERLLETFGSTAGVRAATLHDLLALRWLPDDVARRVHERLTGAALVIGAGDDAR